MAQSRYDGHDHFDFEHIESRYLAPLPVRAEAFPGVMPGSRAYSLRPEVIGPRGHRFGVSRLVVTIEDGTGVLRRRTVSMRWWLLTVLAFFVFVAVVIRWFDQLGEAGALWGSLTFTFFVVFLLLAFPRQDLLFCINEHDVSIRRGRGQPVTRSTSEIQHCEMFWASSEGADGSSLNRHVSVIFDDGQRFDTPQYVEILRAVHWFRSDIPLLEVPPSTQKTWSTRALRPSTSSEGLWWERYEAEWERSEGDLSSSG